MSTAAEEKAPSFKPPQDETYLKWGLIYPRNPRYHYLYPAPTVSTLTNIANSLAAFPKFYIQVLHLMNKMNLPAPFGPTTPTPPTPSGIPQKSSSESELESDTEVPKKKKKRKTDISKQRPKKRMKLIEDFSSFSMMAVEPSKVFELNEQTSSQRPIQLNIPTVIQPQDGTSSATEQSNKSQPMETQTGQSGFGVIEPVAKPVECTETVDTECNEFISEKELRNGRLSERDRREISVFKRYERGDPSCRLYIKNLAKQTSEKDLKYIFGRYIDWTNDVHVNAFDVRVMKEGRMKGQAFVTLPTEDLAVSAVNESHAFVLNEKAMVVQFARSAKAAADPNREDK